MDGDQTEIHGPWLWHSTAQHSQSAQRRISNIEVRAWNGMTEEGSIEIICFKFQAFMEMDSTFNRACR